MEAQETYLRTGSTLANSPLITGKCYAHRIFFIQFSPIAVRRSLHWLFVADRRNFDRARRTDSFKLCPRIGWNEPDWTSRFG